MAGVDLRTVQELAGHKTISMTVRYAHLAPEHNQAAIENSSPSSATTTPLVFSVKKMQLWRAETSVRSARHNPWDAAGLFG